LRALTVRPGVAGSARLDDLPEPAIANGSVLVRTRAIGVCGTDVEILEGKYGWPPPGRDRLVLGHESLGEVEQAPADSALLPGDLVVGIVRRPDPVPCRFCAAGEWDMCANGLYTERGIKERDGYCAERYRIEPAFVVKVDASLGDLGVLLEPASVVAKAWDHTERIGGRSRTWSARTVLVTGAGPIGLLAAMMGRQRGCEVHVFDRAASGPKPQLVRDLGGAYHTGDIADLDSLAPDVVIECTGAPAVIAKVLTRSGASGVTCLAGVSSGGYTIDLDLGSMNRELVLENDAIFGSVNANRRHYEIAAGALARANTSWLQRLISRKVPIDRWHEAIRRQPDDVKAVITF
jgi:threonine dehydrogenase-like Zn-dependent dehydrogenase